MVLNRFLLDRILLRRAAAAAAVFLAGAISLPPRMAAQAPPLRVAAPRAAKAPARPKLVVLLVVDQMRGDYVDKFLGQWTGGLKRLVEEGAWFRDAAYPYAATETCVGHATISTGAFPATHGMVANAWWDRKDQKMVTDRKSTRLNSSHGYISYADFCLKKKTLDAINNVFRKFSAFNDETGRLNVDGMNIISNDGSNKLNRSRKARVSYKVQRTINASLNASTSTRAVSSNLILVTRQKIEITFFQIQNRIS